MPIPEIHAEGEREDGWTYVILQRLPGAKLETVWSPCTPAEKAAFVEPIGARMAEVHAVPVAGLRLTPEWTGFLEGQVAACRSPHERLGMPDWFLAEVHDYVREALPLPRFEPVVLTGEYTPFHRLLESRRITAMIDSGDAMTGFREYDLLGPSLFLCEGRAELVSSLFGGYDSAPPRRRRMALAILHRFSNLKFQIRIPSWLDRVRSVAELERLIWPSP